MFGALHVFRQEHGLPSETEVAIPPQGCAARVLASELDLPMENVQAVFVNHQIYSLDHCIQPGDEVAFVPAGTPGVARGCVGSYGTAKGDGEGR
ncbi:MoaD/ThiS family protein [Geomonas sp.]|uniref:MoaD/ThiS family protein n=1 Tax=Geomonas sp. TaxID=2651584 RepID=UPI002B493DBF|nr:MoaD/ThiS family protein [Geomonas sp.]HJV36546.1 MoaD/ThiS family protein [Geomonas sp.]